jgi:hypothetical protein
MKKNNKAKLRIGQVLYTSLAIIALGIFITIYTIQNNTTLVANNEEQKENIVNEEITTASETTTRTTELEVTSRSSGIREAKTETEEEKEKVEVEVKEDVAEETVEEQYIKIEDVSISKNMDLTVRTGLSKEDFKTLIGNTKQDKTKFFYDNSETIYDLCEKYELNEIFFCGLIAGESGWNIASNHRRTHNYISLMSNGKLISYSTVEEGLETAASTLHNKYLSPSGKFYSGKTLSAVKKRFCPASSTWVDLIYKCMSQIVN